ncbi:nuclear transport factor 2 family protein [Parafrankia sp. BMG5.11]|uniref:nuclear transport factor 2 family protein n=1 Tax=Parafrankia sp. BMG5.11 TaxID=222540 RepID=UPI00103A5BB8|nr:nuclear transport factor 2 family protein [Parafrankia sp. BMG5.11]TCJ37025.1 nuclear transport factor 2 family protein [Parafrankia sp. BMG5.11]
MYDRGQGCDPVDQAAIRNLVALYCRGCDRRDFALVRSLYHDDAVDDHGAMFCGGPDAFVEWLPKAMEPWELTIHSLSNSVIVIDGDVAEGEHMVRAWHRTHPPDRREVIVYGRYLDRYQRRLGEWRFLRRSLVFDHGETRPVDEEALAALGRDAVHGTADRGDPSWALALIARSGGIAR